MRTDGLLDFHTHTKHSDGHYNVSELVDDALAHGVCALALTDHNITSGLPEFNAYCKEKGLFNIPFGTEIHAEVPSNVVTPTDNDAPDMVILGRNPKVDVMKDYYKILLEHRVERFFPKTITGLESIGFYFPHVELDENHPEILGVPKIFHDFVKERDNMNILKSYVQGIDSSIPEQDIRKDPVRFINKYCYAVGRPAYVKRLEGFSVDDAVSFADVLNCKLFIAHPGGEYGWLSDGVLNYFIEHKVPGIEVRSYFNSPEQNRKFDDMAKKHSLIRSGGSDCHGYIGPNAAFKIGIHDRPQNQLPKDILEELWYSLPQ